MKKQMLTPVCGALLLLCGAMLMFTENRAFAQAPHSSDVTIHVRDYCDPTSFNVAIGDGTCVRDTSLGAITFPGFVAELTADQSVGAWRFAPAQISVSEGATLHVVNLGGETHTFTQVKDFGGGFIGFLNDISGNPVLAPECAQVVNGNLVPQPPGPDNIFLSPGGSVTVPLEHEVNAKYQCCVHPWMRLTITPRDLHHTQVR
jgi:plastocyanin